MLRHDNEQMYGIIQREPWKKMILNITERNINRERKRWENRKRSSIHVNFLYFRFDKIKAMRSTVKMLVTLPQYIQLRKRIECIDQLPVWIVQFIFSFRSLQIVSYLKIIFAHFPLSFYFLFFSFFVDRIETFPIYFSKVIKLEKHTNPKFNRFQW